MIMDFADSNFILKPSRGIARISLLFLLLSIGHGAQGLFKSGKEYIYSYDVVSSTGVLVPSDAASSWGLSGKLIIQAEDNFITIQLQSLKTNVWNGNITEIDKNVDIYDDALELLKPFRLSYNKGLVENISIEAEPVWVTNIKRSIAGILQLDLRNLEKKVAFNSNEINHYGKCNIDYVVNPEGDTHHVIRKSFDPRKCIGHSCRNWSNVPKIQCVNEEEHNHILKGSDRIYRLRTNGFAREIISINASGNIYVQPFESTGEAHYYIVRQTMELFSVKDITKKIVANNLRTTTFQHELPETDLTQGRATPDKSQIFKTIRGLLDRLNRRLENPGLETETNNLHNTTLSVLLYYFGMLDRVDLKKVYDEISGTSYKEETIRNIFLEVLPQVRSKESALFALDLIRGNALSDVSAIQLLTRLPFHIRKPDVQLLDDLKPLLSLPNEISVQVQNAAILAHGTLIYKTCLIHCPYETLDDYVRLYLNKYTGSTQYNEKMIWLEGLANIQLSRVVEFLEPIVANTAESRHLRILAAWASLPTASSRPDVIYRTYWPILTNRSENLEMRAAALTLLIVSSPTSNRFMSLYWYMQNNSDQHLYNYFYTMLKSMERSTHPCYKSIGGIAAQFSRILRKPANEHLITGNYVVDYRDSLRRFGTLLNGILIANPSTNIPEVIYITLNNYMGGTYVNQMSLYIKMEGIFHSLATVFNNQTQIKDILKEFKLDKREKGPIYLEVIARVQEKTVLCFRFNGTGIVDGLKYLSFLSDNLFIGYHIYNNIEFHINQQRINVPFITESVQATDFGTNVRLAMMATSFSSIRGNFTHNFFERNYHVILRTSFHDNRMIENYNPLIDLWHSAEKVKSLHGYLPVNITIGLAERPFISYSIPGAHLKSGIVAHSKTLTSIRGAGVKSKLERICRLCPASYTVTKPSLSNSQTVNIFNAKISEFGGKIHVNTFDCENTLSYETLINDIFSSHRSNYQTWPSMRFVLVGLHFLDYFKYIPPKGSCGLSAYIENLDLKPSQTKLEYSRTEKYHLFSLTHRDFETSGILYQWNLAALYESLLLDVLKIKISRIAPDEKVLKFCIEAEKLIPWQWDLLSNEPSDRAHITLNVVWGPSDTIRGRCSGSSVSMNLIGEISNEQIKESKMINWPYGECKKESMRKKFVPYTDSCYEASKELSTLRKYKILAQYENLPESLNKFVWKMYALYDIIGGNSSSTRNSNKLAVIATFPKESNVGELQLNEDKIAIEYNWRFINFFLTQTKIHKYLEISLLKMFSSICVVTLDSIKSAYNISYTFAKNSEVMLLGQCYDENPRLALTATNGILGINVNITDESGNLRITADRDEGVLYNATSRIQLQSNYVFHTIETKKIKKSNKAIDILLSNILLYMHWTQEQVLLFFPNHLLDFSCGICTLDRPNIDKYWEKL